jgi:hypothetical protein
VLVVVAAVTVPTAVLGGAAPPSPGYTVREVVRAFGAEQIPLQRHESRTAPEYTLILGGRFPDRARLDVRVFLPSQGETGNGEFLVFVSSGSARARNSGVGYQGNLMVDWQTRQPCKPDATLVRAALARLATRGSAHGLAGVRCSKVPQYP